MRLGRETEPFVGSISPVKIFIRVDLPAPLGPVMAYRRPAEKVVVTSSKSTRAPYRIETLFTESIALYCTAKCKSIVSAKTRFLLRLNENCRQGPILDVITTAGTIDAAGDGDSDNDN